MNEANNNFWQSMRTLDLLGHYKMTNRTQSLHWSPPA